MAGNAAAAVANRQLNGVSALGTDGDDTAGFAGVAGVGQQVDQHLNQALGLCGRQQPRRTLIDKFHLRGFAVERQQLNGFLDAVVDIDCFDIAGLGVAPLVSEVHQTLHNTGDALGLFDDLVGGFQYLGFAGIVAQVLGEAGNTGYRVAYFVGHPSSEAADGGQAFLVGEFIFHQVGFGDVFDNDDLLAAC